MLTYLLITFALCQPPAPPKPAPAVVAAKAIITLRGGKPVPAKIEVNRTLFLSAKKSTKDPECIVKWVVFPPSLLADPENFSKFEDGTEFALNVGPTEQEILIGAAVSGGKQVDIVAVTIIVGRGPRPPPVPPDPPFPPVPPIPPEPPVPPIPTPAKGFRAIFIYDNGAAMTRPQLITLNSTKIADYLNAKCAKDEKGHSEWRRWPKTMDASKETTTMQQLWAATQPKIDTLPALLIVNDTGGKLMPLPETEAATLTVLKSYGGQ